MLSSKYGNNKASDIKLVYLYSNTHLLVKSPGDHFEDPRFKGGKVRID